MSPPSDLFPEPQFAFPLVASTLSSFVSSSSTTATPTVPTSGGNIRRQFVGTTSSSSPASTTTDSGSSNQFGFAASGSSFYRNLFYILIALLVTFGLVSILSWFRNRRRRIMIFEEAQRLELLVPGMPGYAAERERVLLVMSGLNPSVMRGENGPEMWDVRDWEREKMLLEMEKGKEGGQVEGEALKEEIENKYDPIQGELALKPSLGNAALFPLSAKPIIRIEPTVLKPIPKSTLSFFPQDHALRRPPIEPTTDEIIDIWESGTDVPPGTADAATGEIPSGGTQQIGQLGRRHTRNASTSYPPPAGPPPTGPTSPVAAGKRRASIAPSASAMTSPSTPTTPDRRSVELSFLIRMPTPKAPKTASRKPREGIVPETGEVYQENEEEDVDAAIMDEWQGAEFGVMEIPVVVDTVVVGQGSGQGGGESIETVGGLRGVVTRGA